MATGVPPRDDDIQFTRNDLNNIQDALKNQKFRDLLNEYCEEMRDPATKALYQKEMTQLEKERGYDVTFLNPKGGYVIKTSVAGDRKAFINICSNENVGRPSYKVEVLDGKKGMNWQIPYSMSPPREDYDLKKQRCVVYDVVFHPDTLRMAEVNKQFRELVNKSAFDGLQKTFNINLDNNNFRFPKSHYKGMTTPSVIRKEDPDFKPLTDEEKEDIPPEMIEKLFPQRSYSDLSEPPKPNKEVPPKNTERPKKGKADFNHKTKDGYTIPKYIIKQQKNVDMQEYTYDRDCKQHSAIPSQILVEIYLPLLSSTQDCILDVDNKVLSLKADKPAKYKLDITLPYSVNDLCGNAKFDKTKHKLIVTLPVIKDNLSSELARVDSGVESEENSGSQSDEDNSNLVVEISSTSNYVPTPSPEVSTTPVEMESFFNPSLGYLLPPHTHNVLDNVVAFTFHVKNTEPDSVQVKSDNGSVYIKFTSVGSGFVPVHYAAILQFDDNVTFENVTGEAWDNNVILQLELGDSVPEKFQIGLTSDFMTTEHIDISQIQKISNVEENEKINDTKDAVIPMVEVTNRGSETKIVVSSNAEDLDEDDDDEDDDDDSATSERKIVWTESNNETEAKSILRKPMSMMRSFSESSAGDIASSMDYISSDCIPEESSYKKSVRFNDVISKQFYRYNSSIEGQKKKNQRKKSKKRSSERRKSESEAEDESNNNSQVSQSRLKSALKQRRDSGLADTSDAEGDCRNTPDEHSFKGYGDQGHEYSSNNDDSIPNTPVENDVFEDKHKKESNKSILNIIDTEKKQTEKSPELWETKTERAQKKSDPITCDTIKHKTDLYDPEKLNKGQYLEVTFKNDLIFDLDM